MPRRNYTRPRKRPASPAPAPADTPGPTCQQMALDLVRRGLAAPIILGPIHRPITLPKEYQL